MRCRHVLTSIGTYYLILGAIYTRHCLDGEQKEYYLDWPSWHAVPEIRPIADIDQLHHLKAD